MTERQGKPGAADAASEDPRVEELRKSHGPVHWSDLKAHAERHSLVLFNGDEGLVEVATALALDAVEQVKAWQVAGVLRLPTADELQQWSTQPDKAFESIVVQPFVLARQSGR